MCSLFKDPCTQTPRHRESVRPGRTRQQPYTVLVCTGIVHVRPGRTRQQYYTVLVCTGISTTPSCLLVYLLLVVLWSIGE
jgi:hypothetical protein